MECCLPSPPSPVGPISCISWLWLIFPSRFCRPPSPPSAESSWLLPPPLPGAPGMGGLFRYSFTLRQCSSSLSVFGSWWEGCRCNEFLIFDDRSTNGNQCSGDLNSSSSFHLHPEEQSLGSRLELQHIDSTGGALGHFFKFTVIREDDQILERETHNIRNSYASVWEWDSLLC